MKRKAKLVIGLAVVGLGCCLMAGCQPKVFGVDEKVWSTLSEEERKQIIEGYNQEKLEREKNAIIHETADTAKTLIWMSK